jgi:hypothetical protein
MGVRMLQEMLRNIFEFTANLYAPMNIFRISCDFVRIIEGGAEWAERA